MIKIRLVLVPRAQNPEIIGLLICMTKEKNQILTFEELENIKCCIAFFAKQDYYKYLLSE